MDIAIRITSIHDIRDVASCVDSWTHVADFNLGGEAVAAGFVTVLIWTLIAYRRRRA